MADQTFFGVKVGVRCGQNSLIPPFRLFGIPQNSHAQRCESQDLQEPRPTLQAFRREGPVPAVNPSGGRLWRFRYRYAGVEKLLAMGKYPDTSLQKAREQRDEARVVLAGGGDPGMKRKIEKSALVNTFEAVAKEWLEMKRGYLTESTWQRDRDQLMKMVGLTSASDPFPLLRHPTCSLSCAVSRSAGFMTRRIGFARCADAYSVMQLRRAERGTTSARI